MQQKWGRWAIVAAVIVGIVVVAKFAGGKLAGWADVKNPKVSLYSWLVIGLMALTFIVVGKVITAKWRIPGLTELFHAA